MTLAATRLLNHSLIVTVRGLRGNARGVVYTEPMWGLAYNLYAPYVSVYMLTLGLQDTQIGLIASIGLACQFFWTLVSGAITDKFGRKRTTLVTDIIAWSVPCLIWAVAQDFNYFLIAALVNSLWRVTHNSWLCLLVEDTEPSLLVDIYSLIYISGLVAAFFAPLTSLLIAQFTLVPTMRGLYFFSFVLMTAKFLTMNVLVTESTQGKVRMEETRRQSLWTIMRGSRGVLCDVLHSRETLITGALMVIVSIATTVHITFWSILVTEKLQVPASYLSFYYVARSATMLLFYFMVMPYLRNLDARKPMVFGFAGLILSWSILINIPAQSYWLLLITVILEGCSVPATSTLLDKLIATTVDPKERARVMAILYMVVIGLTSPFGWIAGLMSGVDRSLPFVLNIVLVAAGAILAYTASRPRLVTPQVSDVASS
jgi:MFS family permease